MIGVLRYKSESLHGTDPTSLLEIIKSERYVVSEEKFDSYTADAITKHLTPLIMSIINLTEFFWSGDHKKLEGLHISELLSEEEFDPWTVGIIHTTYRPVVEQFAEIALSTIAHYQGARFGSSWRGVVLSDSILESLRSIEIGLIKAASLRKAGFSVPRSLLLYGPPGTGKTEIAKAMAASCNRVFKPVTTANLKAKYLGQSGHLVQDLFKDAREDGPAILFIDELDAVASERGRDEMNDEIIGQLLQEMEGFDATPERVYVVGATNNLEMIDPAIRQRFAAKIRVAPPSFDQRVRLIRALLGRRLLDTSPAYASYRAAEISRDRNLVGRDYRDAIYRAEQRAVFRAAQATDFDSELNLRLEDLVREIQAVVPEQAE